jgi:hypothetical protein
MNDLRPPRYWPQRALPERAFVPGRAGTKPAAGAEPPYVAAERWRDNEAYLWGADLFNHGYAWEAHEAWEGLWRAAKDDETQATFLQGLIQCAAARVKVSMDDASAAQRVRERGLARLMLVRARHGERYMGLELARYLAEEAASRQSGARPKLWLSL